MRILELYIFCNRGRRKRHTFATPSSLSVGIGVILANLKSLLSNRFYQGLLLLFIDNSDSEFLELTFDLATQEFRFMGILELCIVSCFEHSTLGNQEFCSGKNSFHELLTLFLRALGRTRPGTAQNRSRTLPIHIDDSIVRHSLSIFPTCLEFFCPYLYASNMSGMLLWLLNFLQIEIIVDVV